MLDREVGNKYSGIKGGEWKGKDLFNNPILIFDYCYYIYLSRYSRQAQTVLRFCYKSLCIQFIGWFFNRPTYSCFHIHPVIFDNQFSFGCIKS